MQQSTVHVDGHDVDEWKNKHPYQVDKVPVQTADLNVFVTQLVNPRSNH
jgi:hypothetical protein